MKNYHVFRVFVKQVCSRCAVWIGLDCFIDLSPLFSSVLNTHMPEIVLDLMNRVMNIVYSR